MKTRKIPSCDELIDMMENNKNRRVRNDILFIAVLLILAAIGGIYLRFFRTVGNIVIITVDGAEYGTYSLSEDRIEEIRTGADDEQLNRLVISGGKAFIETANCPDGICAAHRPINRDGESIVCLPHRVVITAVGDEDNGLGG